MPKQLSLETTLKAHRELWDWIADTTEKTKRIPDKHEYPKEPDIKNCIFHCYACEYARQKAGIKYSSDIQDWCKSCPLQWPPDKTGLTDYPCCIYGDNNGLFGQWENCKDILETKQTSETKAELLQKSIKLAKQIANLKPKEGIS